ncbi:MAG: diguanylate cyclase [bacterium]
MAGRLSGNLGDVLLRAVEQSPSIVVITDLSGLIEYVNPFCCKATGYSRDELVGRDSNIFKSGEMSPGSYEELWKDLASGMDWRGDFHNRRKSGELYWEAATISPIRNAKGETEHYLKVAEDITTQKALEVELNASRERYERVVTATRGFMFTVLLKDSRPVRTLYYPGSLQVTGYTAAEYQVDRLLWYRMIVEEDRAAVTAQIAAVINERITRSVEHRIRHKNGAIRWVRNISVPTLDESGRMNSYDGLINDITELKEAQAVREELVEKMRRMAVHDALTGLYSRRGFEEELNRVWLLGERRGMSTGLLIMDVDRFKVLNDTYGHPVGDQVLIEAAELITSTVRSVDVVSRYGGDEIVVLLPLTGIEETRRIADRIMEAFRRHIFSEGTRNLHVTISIGAAFGSGDSENAQMTLIKADQALLQAKQAGRDRVCFAEASSPLTPAVPPGNRSTPQSGSLTPERTTASLGRILVLDDEQTVCELVATLLRRAGYSVATAFTADEAISIASRERGTIDASLVDIKLGDNRDGLEILAKLRQTDDAMSGIVMTGYASVTIATSAIKIGACDFLQKPFPESRLLEAVARAMQYRTLLQENRHYQRHLEAMVAERSAALSHALDETRKSHRETLEVLAGMLETREHMTGEHCKRVARMAELLAVEMELSESEVETVTQGALLHDIGKIIIPDSILLKRDSLTSEEWNIVRSHPKLGHDVVGVSPALTEVAEIVYSHHERFDGTGYPRGLKGSEICIGARIFAIVDTYDAIRSNRPYSPSQSVEVALVLILNEQGKQFDPLMVQAFMRCQKKIETCVGEPSAGTPAAQE